MEREQQLRAFIAAHVPQHDFSVEFAAADADFRRYWRIILSDNSTLIAMDVISEKMNIQPYLTVNQIFSDVRVPEIYASDIKNGFILMEDFGKITFLDALKHDSRLSVHKTLLLEAIDTLIDLQKSSKPHVLPEYDETLLRREMNLFIEWYIPKVLQKSLTHEQQSLWKNGVNKLIPVLMNQPKVFVHRDFIVRNLMLMRGKPGILDFQDAVYGANTYDLLSLTRDAFISWDEEFILDLVIRYWEKAKQSGLEITDNFDDFYRDYEWMGVQRHFKVIGIFSRLKYRDNKDKYFDEIPRFIGYLRKTLRRYAPLSDLYRLLNELCPDDSVQTGYTF